MFQYQRGFNLGQEMHKYSIGHYIAAINIKKISIKRLRLCRWPTEMDGWQIIVGMLVFGNIAVYSFKFHDVV